MLSLPEDDPTSALRLADWLELFAILSPDGNSSSGDLESALRVAAYRNLTDDEAIEAKVLEVFWELRSRGRAAGQAYPFTFPTPPVLQTKAEWRGYLAYVFCLCLSYRGAYQAGQATRLFEELACRAAGEYLQGQAIRFGSPRQDLPSAFPEAIDEVCRRIGEGEGYGGPARTDAKDDGLDVVAWKDFADKAGSKLVMFGQCAAGADWEDKRTELQPDAFLGNWIKGRLVSPDPVRSFFVPHRVLRADWERTARYAGLLFDRCRVAYWAHREGEIDSEQEDWVKEYLDEVVES